MGSRGQEIKNNEFFEHPSNFPEKVVIVDADSLIYRASYSGKDEFGVKKEEYTLENGGYEIAEGILTDMVFEILNNIEQFYKIKQVFFCVKGKNNIRQSIFLEYKAQRPTPAPIIPHLFEFFKNKYNPIISDGYEADDYCYTIMKKLDYQGIICGIDRDLHQIPGLHFNYATLQWKLISKEAARLHLAKKLLTGDSGDNVLINKGLGEAKASKIVNLGMSDYTYIRKIFETYKKYNGENAKKLLKQTYFLLKLYEVSL
jgi:DNA polymerase I